MYCNSAIIAALALAKLTKKLKIHNWNYYMNSSPKNYGYFKVAYIYIKGQKLFYESENFLFTK